MSQREAALEAAIQRLEQRLREQAQEMKRHSALHQLVLENVGVGVIAADKDGRFLLWNRVAERILGEPQRDVPPEHWAAHYGVYASEGGEPIAVEELPLIRAIRGEKITGREIFVQPQNRPEGVWLSVTAQPMLGDDGSVVGGVVLMEDVTEKRRLRLRLDESRMRLFEACRLALAWEIASGMAHELSQPLTAIANYAGAAVKMLESGRLDAERLQGVLASINRQAERGGSVLERLRTLSMHKPSALTWVSIGAVLNTALRLMETRLNKVKVRIDRRFDAELPEILADEAGLEEAFVHLLMSCSTSVLAAEEDQRVLQIVTSQLSDPHGVAVDLSWEGEDISAEWQGIDQWLSAGTGFMALRLAVVRSIVESCRGMISVRSRRPTGSIIRLELLSRGEPEYG